MAVVSRAPTYTSPKSRSNPRCSCSGVPQTMFLKSGGAILSHWSGLLITQSITTTTDRPLCYFLDTNSSNEENVKTYKVFSPYRLQHFGLRTAVLSDASKNRMDPAAPGSEYGPIPVPESQLHPSCLGHRSCEPLVWQSGSRLCCGIPALPNHVSAFPRHPLVLSLLDGCHACMGRHLGGPDLRGGNLLSQFIFSG